MHQSTRLIQQSRDIYITATNVIKFGVNDQRSSFPTPSQECYVLLGDFHARVGSRSECDTEWWDERGLYGHGVLNKSWERASSLFAA